MQAKVVGRVAGAEHAALLEEDAATAQERRETARARDGLRDALRLLDDVQHAQTPVRHPRERADSLEGGSSPAPLTHNNVSTRRRDRSPGPQGSRLLPQRRRRGRVASRASSPRARRTSCAGGADPSIPFSHRVAHIAYEQGARARQKSSGATWTTFVFSNSSSAIIAPKRLK